MKKVQKKDLKISGFYDKLTDEIKVQVILTACAEYDFYANLD